MYSKEPVANLHYDKVTLDGPRDFQGELQERRRKYPVFDEKAIKRMEENKKRPTSHTTGFTEEEIKGRRPHRKIIDPNQLAQL